MDFLSWLFLSIISEVYKTKKEKTIKAKKKVGSKLIKQRTCLTVWIWSGSNKIRIKLEAPSEKSESRSPSPDPGRAPTRENITPHLDEILVHKISHGDKNIFKILRIGDTFQQNRKNFLKLGRSQLILKILGDNTLNEKLRQTSDFLHQIIKDGKVLRFQ